MKQNKNQTQPDRSSVSVRRNDDIGGAFVLMQPFANDVGVDNLCFHTLLEHLNNVEISALV